MDKKTYGVGGRLAKSSGELLIDTAYRHDCEDGKHLLPFLHLSDIAYVLTLKRGNIISDDIASELLDGLKRVNVRIENTTLIDHQYGDIYNFKHDLLKNEIGDVAGWIHIGRPRREAINVAYMLCVRQLLVEFFQNFILMSEELLTLVKAHSNTLMPDFTYSHYAQPTSLGHYLGTFLFPMLRDMDRFRGVWNHFDSCPAGSGPTNGTSLPVDRALLKDLLGFSTLTDHSRDAMWQPDPPSECIAAISIYMMNISRICEEFINWNSSEYAYIEMPDDMSRSSVVMPQKKNPYALCYVRGLANESFGKFSSYCAYGSGVSGFPDSRTFIYGDITRTISKADESARLMAGVFSDIDFNKKKLHEKASDYRLYSSELAEYLVITTGVDYRTAHEIVGKLVVVVESGDDRTIDYVCAQLITIIDSYPDIRDDIDDSSIREIFNPESVIEKRVSIGGVAKSELSRQCEQYQAQLDNFKQWIDQIKKSTDNSELLGLCDNHILGK